MTEQETKNRVVVMVTGTLCVFLLLSLAGTFALEWAGKESGTIWGRIFDLVNVLTGALVGYLAGTQVEKARLSGGNDAPDPGSVDDDHGPVLGSGEGGEVDDR
jgi:hypothetical protein